MNIMLHPSDNGAAENSGISDGWRGHHHADREPVRIDPSRRRRATVEHDQLGDRLDALATYDMQLNGSGRLHTGAGPRSSSTTLPSPPPPESVAILSVSASRSSCMSNRWRLRRAGLLLYRQRLDAHADRGRVTRTAAALWSSSRCSHPVMSPGDLRSPRLRRRYFSTAGSDD